MKLFNWKTSKASNGEEKAATPQAAPIPEADVAVAIALALHQYMNEVKEYEKAILTFGKIMKPYSPWNSKFYGLRQQPMYIPRQRQVNK